MVMGIDRGLDLTFVILHVLGEPMYIFFRSQFSSKIKSDCECSSVNQFNDRR